MAVKNGDTVKVEYTGTFDDGTIFDSLKEYGEPMEFVVGSGQLIEGFNDAVVGMQLGEEKEIRLQPEDAYGNPREAMRKKIPRDAIPEEELAPGMQLGMQLESGEVMPAWIIAVTEENVTIDLNHPLAGKTLNFKIKLIEISSPE